MQQVSHRIPAAFSNWQKSTATPILPSNQGFANWESFKKVEGGLKNSSNDLSQICLSAIQEDFNSIFSHFGPTEPFVPKSFWILIIVLQNRSACV